MAARRGSKPGGKKGKGKGVSAEEQERLRREEEEAERRLRTQQLEKDAEDFQARECRERDHLEVKERKRQRKEQQAALLVEKDANILSLSQQVNDQMRTFATVRAELEDELDRMTQLKDTLSDELSTLQVESDQQIRGLGDTVAQLQDQKQQLERQLHGTEAERDQVNAELEERTAALKKQVSQAEERLTLTEQCKDEHERESTARLHNMERELEKTVALCRTLQEVIETREADDKKNVTLMSLLNQQLDENKRRAQNLLDAEKGRAGELEAKVAQHEKRAAEFTKELNALRAERDEALRRAEQDAAEYKSKLEQVKFDAKFVHSELTIYKTKLSQQRGDQERREKEVTSDAERTKLDLEAANQKIEQLEASLRKKDRDHFDKVTFLNAQISNNRTIISQLQQKFSKEKEARMQEVQALNDELASKTQRLSAAQHDLDKKKLASSEVEAKLQSDVSILKTTVFQLQSALVEKERELENIVADKDEENRRLRKKLDENFIPHRRELDGTEAGSKPLEQALNEKIQKLSRDLEVRSRVALDTETRLNAQIANLNQVMEALQIELKTNEDHYGETVKALQMENQRLKSTLDANFVPHQAE
eukprot:TRINITY_DN70106_c0_g1_i1.p1 TRINITY_DN70106_c0_g1~~TRINITY_DN70106_c0_g1_i1.p1  ORF type:complete len:628 (+),score=326.48 TRINITY_DN70106_c0_g1_i1:94-1884(+)